MDFLPQLRVVPLLACCPLLACAGAMAGEHYEGLAHARDGKRLLYRESHWIDGDRHLVLYRCPDGKPFARKRLDRSPDATSPDFELLDARDGYREGVRRTAAGREVFVQASAGSAPRSAALRAARPVIDAGFDAFVHAAWDRLAGTQPVAMRFVVPSQLRAMDFTVARVAGDADSRRYRLALDAWYGALLPPIVVDYALAGRQLLRYRGVGNIRSGKGKHLSVDIRFPRERRRAASAGELDAAAAAPLAGRCTL